MAVYCNSVWAFNVYGQCVAIEHLYCALCIVWLCYGYGMVRYGHWADGRARTAPTDFAFPSASSCKGISAATVPYLAKPVLSKTPRLEEWLLTLSAHGFFGVRNLLLSMLVQHNHQHNSLLKYQFLCLKAD